MIVIKDLDFEMEQIKGTPFFNLKMPVVINEGTPKERVDMRLVGYGMPFKSCLKQIISYKLDTEDKSYTMAEYMKEYDKVVAEIVKLVKFDEKRIVSEEIETLENELSTDD
jgi:hypothetical protein